MPVLDSGVRREFESGAVRDICEGKGRCDLLPLYECSLFLRYQLGDTYKNVEGRELIFIDSAISEHNLSGFIYAAVAFVDENFKDRYDALLEVSKHFEDGAVKYGDNNWQKGIPAHCYLDSGIRHYLKFNRGDDDERHDRAFLWNMLCLAWTLRNKPELNDLWEVPESLTKRLVTNDCEDGVCPIAYDDKEE